MRLKYYLKGFGIGVLFATGVLSISFYAKTEDKITASLSQQEIESLAKQLGMEYATEETKKETESSKESQTSTTIYETQTQKETVTTVELETTTNTKETTTILETTTKAKETTKPAETTTRAKETTKPVETIESLETAMPEAVSKEYMADGETESAEWKQIIVKSGMGSKTIASLLQEAGVIEDAEDFNRYMVSFGYSTRIRTGTYNFLPGTSYEAIVTEFTRIPKTGR